MIQVDCPQCTENSDPCLYHSKGLNASFIFVSKVLFTTSLPRSSKCIISVCGYDKILEIGNFLENKSSDGFMAFRLRSPTGWYQCLFGVWCGVSCYIMTQRRTSQMEDGSFTLVDAQNSKSTQRPPTLSSTNMWIWRPGFCLEILAGAFKSQHGVYNSLPRLAF